VDIALQPSQKTLLSHNNPCQVASPQELLFSYRFYSTLQILVETSPQVEEEALNEATIGIYCLNSL